VLAGLVIVVLFAAVTPLVDMDGCILTVDTPSVVLGDVAVPAEAADAYGDGKLQELVDGDVQRAPRMDARGAIVVVAARWALVLRRWHRAFRGGIPS